MIKGSVSVPRTNRSGSGSRRPKNIGSGSATLLEIRYFRPVEAPQFPAPSPWAAGGSWHIGPPSPPAPPRLKTYFKGGDRNKKYTVCIKQCCGSVTFLYGSGYADPCTSGSLTCYFRPWPSRRQQNNYIFLSFSAYFVFKIHLHHFSKLKSHKEITKQ